MAIRIPDLTNLQSAQVNAPQANPAMAVATTEGLGSLAASIAGVGSAFQEVADRTQKLENARLASEFRNRLSEDYSSLQIELDKDPNADRVGKTREFYIKARDRLSTASVSPHVRDQLSLQINEDASRATIAAGARAAEIAHSRAGEALSHEVTQASLSGDRVRLDRALNDGFDAGVLTPEGRVKIEDNFDREQSIISIEADTAEAPVSILMDIDEPGFLERNPGITERDLPQIRQKALRSVERLRQEQIELMQQALDVGRLHPRDIEAAHLLTPLDVEQVKQALESKARNRVPTPEEHSKAWSSLLELRKQFSDPSVDDLEYASKFNDTRASLLGLLINTPSGFKNDLTSELEKRSPSNRSAEKLQPKSISDYSDLRAIALDRIQRARAAGMLGDVSSEASLETRGKAFRREEELRLQVSTWLKQNQNLTIDQVTEFVDSRLTNDRVKSSAADLRSFIPGAAQSLRPSATDPGLPTGPGITSDALLPPVDQLNRFLDQ